jgi:hypothetical protein
MAAPKLVDIHKFGLQGDAFEVEILPGIMRAVSVVVVIRVSGARWSFLLRYELSRPTPFMLEYIRSESSECGIAIMHSRALPRVPGFFDESV